MRLLAAAFVGLLPLLVLSTLGQSTRTPQSSARVEFATHERGHTWNVRWHGPEQHLHVLRAIKQHDEWVVGNAARFHFAADLTAFHRREWRHAMRKILWAKANVARTATYGVPSWFVAQALCVHSHEGSWTDEGYFYGGMQFLLSTWRAHGGLRFGWNPARATPMQQIAVAYWTWRDDGGSWQEWPNTARMCGYL